MIDGEEKLIKSAINGEASAFGLLYDRYQPKIYRFIYFKVSHREEAEDLCHQVFLNAWQNISGYKHKGFPFSAWLYSIARNRIIDYYRANREIVSIEKIDIAIEDAKNAVHKKIEHKLELEKIRETLKGLSQLEQDIIIMRFIEEMSLKEVAKALQKNELSVRVMQNRAIKKLKKLISL